MSRSGLTDKFLGLGLVYNHTGTYFCSQPEGMVGLDMLTFTTWEILGAPKTVKGSWGQVLDSH